MYYRMIDLLIYAPLPVMVFVAWRLDLFKCAVLTGRSFFAFLFSMLFFAPPARLSAAAFDVPLPYLNATWFAVIWFAVWMLLPAAVLKVIQPAPRAMKFTRPQPGKLLTGMIAGWFAVSAFAAFLVMIPEVEGLYFANGTYPFFLRDRRRGAHRSSLLFYSFTFRNPDILRSPQMEAAAEWLRGEISGKDDDETLAQADGLLEYFEQRYTSPWRAEELDMRRKELGEELRDLLSEVNAESAPEQTTDSRE